MILFKKKRLNSYELVPKEHISYRVIDIEYVKIYFCCHCNISLPYFVPTSNIRIPNI